MQRFQQLTTPKPRAGKGLRLESVGNAADRRMRTICVNERGVVPALDHGSDVFPPVNVVRHDDAYSRAAKQLYTTNAATKAFEVRNVRVIEQLTPQLGEAAVTADSLLFAEYPDTVLRELGIDEQALRAVRTIVDKPQSEAFGTLLSEDRFEVLSTSTNQWRVLRAVVHPATTTCSSRETRAGESTIPGSFPVPWGSPSPAAPTGCVSTIAVPRKSLPGPRASSLR